MTLRTTKSLSDRLETAPETMQFPPQRDQWNYFIGRTGNLHDVPRRGAEWFDEETGKWKPCFEVNHNGLRFLPEVKYRIKRTDMP